MTAERPTLAAVVVTHRRYAWRCLGCDWVSEQDGLSWSEDHACHVSHMVRSWMRDVLADEETAVRAAQRMHFWLPESDETFEFALMDARAVLAVVAEALGVAP